LAVALVAALAAAGVCLALDAWLAHRLRAALDGVRMPGPGEVVRLATLGRWECRALTGGLWWLPLAPQLARLPLAEGVTARPAAGVCAPSGLAPVDLVGP
jgi:hypothetical protein